LQRPHLLDGVLKYAMHPLIHQHRITSRVLLLWSIKQSGSFTNINTITIDTAGLANISDKLSRLLKPFKVS
jgi:hypothetical protein